MSHIERHGVEVGRSFDFGSARNGGHGLLSPKKETNYQITKPPQPQLQQPRADSDFRFGLSLLLSTPSTFRYEKGFLLSFSSHGRHPFRGQFPDLHFVLITSYLGSRVRPEDPGGLQAYSD